MMAGDSIYSEFENFFGSLATGVCAIDNWILYECNMTLRRLLDLKDDLPSIILEEWLVGRKVNILSSSELASATGQALIHDPNGRLLYFCWKPAQVQGKRNVAILQLPISYDLFSKVHGPLDKIHSAEIWTSALEYINDGIWIIDGNGITRYINKALELIAGIKAEEVVGKHVTTPLKEGRFKTCVTLEALRTRRRVTLFDDYSNGKRCLNTSTPIFDDDGEIKSVIAVIHDMTELEELQTKLVRLEVETMAYRQRVMDLDKNMEGGLMGHSPLLDATRRDILKAAHSDAVTLILGETGTGKSMAAKVIHDMSSRADKPFIALNCGAISSTLMEAEIFGYEGGAFTGALRGGKPGMLELAGGGTLLLDEVGELPLSMQAKLLHVLDGQPFFRVGGIHPISMKARLIAATNRDLESMVEKGQFRMDFFYRLRILNVSMPPLRDRHEDILLLAWYFLRKATEKTGRELLLDPRTEQFFLSYRWPGNVRELKSVIQSVVTLNRTGVILPSDLPDYMHEDEHCEQPISVQMNLPKAVADLERKMLTLALTEMGSTYKAARRLGISQSAVIRKAKKYGISTALLPKSDGQSTPVKDGDYQIIL